MRLPEIAVRMRELAVEHRCPELLTLADEIRRRPVSRGKTTSRRVDDEMRRQIRSYAEALPDLSMMQIAKRFNVNHGRVSEALKGFRQ